MFNLHFQFTKKYQKKITLMKTTLKISKSIYTCILNALFALLISYVTCETHDCQLFQQIMPAQLYQMNGTC